MGRLTEQYPILAAQLRRHLNNDARIMLDGPDDRDSNRAMAAWLESRDESGEVEIPARMSREGRVPVIVCGEAPEHDTAPRFTPGPWVVRYGDTVYAAARRVADCGLVPHDQRPAPSIPEDEANAALIADAPAMLALLADLYNDRDDSPEMRRVEEILQRHGAEA